MIFIKRELWELCRRKKEVSEIKSVYDQKIFFLFVLMISQFIFSVIEYEYSNENC